MEFYDTHAHLDHPGFADEMPELVERAGAAGISRMICIATDDESSEQAIRLSGRFPQIYAVAGWHPSYVEGAPDDVRDLLRQLAARPKVVALGETGLDFSRLPKEGGREIREKQERLFRQHLEVAGELGLNCVVHQRNALAETLEVMREWRGKTRGVFHCFVDGPAAMEEVLEIGSIVSFTGIMTFKNGEAVRETAAAVPAGSFMLETDSPYLAPVPYRGKRCEPAYVREIAQTVAEVRGESMEELGAHTCRTAREFFRGLE